MYVALSILFLILLLLFIFYGWGIVMRRSGEGDGNSGQKCSICRKYFPKDRLVEREIGDYKILYFCTDCIKSLSIEAAQSGSTDHKYNIKKLDSR